MFINTSTTIQLLRILVLTILVHQQKVICFKKKKLWSTPFPIITLPPSSYYTIYPGTLINYTFPTIYTTGTGGSGPGGRLPPFPTLPGNPTLPNIPVTLTFPTIATYNPGGAVGGLPPFPTAPAIIAQPPPQNYNNNYPPSYPQTPSIPIQCPPIPNLCPPQQGPQIAFNFGQPQTPIGPSGGILPRQYSNCPCVNPRAGQIQQQSALIRKVTSMKSSLGICFNIIICHFMVELFYKNAEPLQKLFCGCSTNNILVEICLRKYESLSSSSSSTTTTTTAATTTIFLTALGTLIPFVQSIGDANPQQNINNYYQNDLLTSCGISNYSQTRIVGGTDAQPGQFPWLAALGYINNSDKLKIEFYCAGSLITAQHIITTAHCISANLWLARLGLQDISITEGPNIIDAIIDLKIIHEHYNSNIILNDIALLKLKNHVPINKRIRPICLPLTEPLKTKDFAGYHPFIAGWGSTGFQGPLSNILQMAQVRIVSLNDCEKKYKQFFPNQIFDNRVICAGYSGKDTCQGDSGGPLMLPQIISLNSPYYYYVLIGIVSYGYECAKDEFPGVYTRVAAYIPWIQNHIND